MSEIPFVDHYDILQVSQGADGETIERVYRLLAKRYHPDNSTTGNVDHFTEVRRAYEVLSSAEQRAEYDVKYDTEKSLQWQIFEQGAAMDSHEQDRRVFHGILSLLYVARRRNPEDGGLGTVHLEKMLGTPREHLEFPLWYLRRRGWVERLHNGLLAITVDGIDKLGTNDLALPHDRLLTESSVGGLDSDEAGQRAIESHDGDGTAESLAV